jgi:hypothetical protein
MIDYSMIINMELLTVFFSVDAGLAMLANTTHIRSRGAMHINQIFEGEV